MPSLQHHLLLPLLSSLLLTSFAHRTLRNVPKPIPPPAPPVSPAVRSACGRARYPSLCMRTLAPSAVLTPAALAHDATSASLASTRAALTLLRRLASSSGAAERGAALDCTKQLAGAADELARTEAELGRLRTNTLRTQLGNSQTWASAALTNTYMCLDALRAISGPTAAAAAPRVSDVSKLASNALYLVNRCSTIGGRHH